MRAISREGKNAIVNPKQRDLHYDLWKGIATLNIILIHTAFWSGESYVPDLARSLVLFLDVPFFLFCSGACQHYVPSARKQISSLRGLYLKWLLFLPVYWLLILVTEGDISKREMLRNLFFSGNINGSLPVVMGSTWFWPPYLITSLIGCVTVKSGADSRKALTGSIVFYAAILILWHTTRNTMIRHTVKYALFLAMYFFGYESFSGTIRGRTFILAESICAGTALLSLLGSAGAMIEAKSPPTITYAAFSLLMVFLSMRLKRAAVKRSILTWTGQNCLMFFFAQGLSSSILYSIVPAFSAWNWVFRLLTCYLINLLLACGIAFLLIRYYHFVTWLFKMVVRTKGFRQIKLFFLPVLRKIQCIAEKYRS